MGLDDRRKMGSLYFSSRESGTPNIVMKEGILPLNLMSPGLHHNKQGHSWELMSKTMQNTNTTFSVKLNHEQTHSGEKSSSIISQPAQPKALNRWQEAKIFQIFFWTWWGALASCNLHTSM